MSNEVLWLVMLLANFMLILVAYRLWGEAGLLVWIALAGVVANVQVTKTVMLFGMTATLGNIVYASSFLATDILSERYGKKAAQRGVALGFFSVLVVTFLMQIALVFSPAPSDTMQPALQEVFGALPRIVLASLIAYLVSQLHDVWAFQFWKERFPRHLWLRNIMSTIVSQLLDTLVFVAIAFIGVFPGVVILQILLTTYLLKALVALLDTPCIYLAMRLRPDKGETSREEL